jgi:hypothetical protein
MKIFVSLTTTPTRLPLIRTTLISLINQNFTAEKIIVNLPKIFRRTGESYPDIHDVFPKPLLTFFSSNRVLFHILDVDYGPITKLVGGLNYLEKMGVQNAYIVTVDDDVEYNKYILRGYIKLIKLNQLNHTNLDTAMGYTGFNFEENNHPVWVHDHREECQILEGYLSVCYKSHWFSNKPFKEYLLQTLQNPNCWGSDDYIISNWLEKCQIKRMVISYPLVNKKRMWQEKAILEIGQKHDALHRGAVGGINNISRYKKAKEFLQFINCFFFKRNALVPTFCHP